MKINEVVSTCPDCGGPSDQQIHENLEYKGYRCRKDCSGHIAGYEWARQRNITDPEACPYRPSHPSFHEGCRSYAEQR